MNLNNSCKLSRAIPEASGGRRTVSELRSKPSQFIQTRCPTSRWILISSIVIRKIVLEPRRSRLNWFPSTWCWSQVHDMPGPARGLGYHPVRIGICYQWPIARPCACPDCPGSRVQISNRYRASFPTIRSDKYCISGTRHTPETITVLYGWQSLILSTARYSVSQLILYGVPYRSQSQSLSGGKNL